MKGVAFASCAQRLTAYRRMSGLLWLVAIAALWFFKEPVNAAFAAVVPETFEGLASLTVLLAGFTVYWIFKLSRAIERLQEQVYELSDQRGQYDEAEDEEEWA